MVQRMRTSRKNVSSRQVASKHFRIFARTRFQLWLHGKRKKIVFYHFGRKKNCVLRFWGEKIEKNWNKLHAPQATPQTPSIPTHAFLKYISLSPPSISARRRTHKYPSFPLPSLPSLSLSPTHPYPTYQTPRIIYQTTTHTKRIKQPQTTTCNPSTSSYPFSSPPHLRKFPPSPQPTPSIPQPHTLTSHIQLPPTPALINPGPRARQCRFGDALIHAGDTDADARGGGAVLDDDGDADIGARDRGRGRCGIEGGGTDGRVVESFGGGGGGVME